MAHVLCKGLCSVGRRGVSMMAGAVRHVNAPTKMSAVTYTFVDGMLDKRGPHRSEHLDLLNAMTQEGSCLLGGAFAEPCDGSVLLFSSPEKAQQFVERDPYYTAGLVTNYQIRPYMAVVGTMLDK